MSSRSRPPRRIADRAERTREPLLADRRRRLRRDPVDDPRDPGQDHAAADDERDEDVGPPDRLLEPGEPVRRRRPRVAQRVEHRAVGRARVLELRESPEHEPGREADLRDQRR